MMSSSFIQRLNKKEIIISDGATGTNLQKRGLQPGLPAEVWIIENPEQIQNLHRDFIESGAEIILTCTFGATSIRLEQVGFGKRVKEVNQIAVELARSAADGKEVMVAGSMGPTGVLLEPMGPLDAGDAERAFEQQASALERGGIDLFVIETQFDLAEAQLAVKAVRSVSSKPIVCSFSFDRGTRTMMGVKPAQLVESLPGWGVDVIGVNCGKSPEDNFKVLLELRRSTDLPIWFKPNAGLPSLDKDGVPMYSFSPSQMGEWVPKWIDGGANVIGGCCGTSPEHLKAISTAVKRV
jgi:5-methyltetrahydrofolate--homocysteine methyltransferase